jgi:hypothetical protein
LICLALTLGVDIFVGKFGYNDGLGVILNHGVNICIPVSHQSVNVQK